MLKDRKRVLIFLIIIFIGIVIAVNVVNKIRENSAFENTRNSYEEIIKGISVDDISNNTYITSISIETDFEMKNSYDGYNTQYDMIDIIVQLSNDFETLDIKDRVVILQKADEEISTILTNGKDTTGYTVLLDDYAPYKGSKVQVVEDLDIDFKSASKTYTFCVGLYHSRNRISIQGEDGKFGYTTYDVQWDGDAVVSVKEEQSSGNYTPVEEDYNSLTYQTVTDDDTLGEVWAMAQSFVKDQLKSPKSADFPTYGDSSVSITNSGDYYKVTGYVDAENSFGAEIRSTFSLVLKKGGSKYTLKECNIY